MSVIWHLKEIGDPPTVTGSASIAYCDLGSTLIRIWSIELERLKYLHREGATMTKAFDNWERDRVDVEASLNWLEDRFGRDSHIYKGCEECVFVLMELYHIVNEPIS